MAKIKNMQTTPSETSIIKGLVAHGMTKDLSQEIVKAIKGLTKSSTTETKAPNGLEYATKVDLLNVKMEINEKISKLEVSLTKEIASSRDTTIKWFVSLFFAQIIAIIGAIKYFIQ